MVGKRVLLGLSVLLCLLFGTCSLGTDIETLRERFPEDTQIPVAADYNISIISPQEAGRAIIPVIIKAREGKSSGKITVYYYEMTGGTHDRTTTVPSAAGIYAVTFDVAAAPGWSAARGFAAGTLVLTDLTIKYDPSIWDYNISGTGEFTYDGSQREVIVTRKDNDSSPGAVTVWYRDVFGTTTTTPPSAAGAYSVIFDVEASGDWKAASGLSAGTVIITDPVLRYPVASDFTITGLGVFTYDGNAKAVTITPQNGKSQGTITVKYNGSTTDPSAVGTYTVTFDVAAAEGWNAVSGLYAGTLTINTGTLSGNVTISPSGNVTIGTELAAAYSGTEAISFQWNKDGAAVSGATTNKHTPTTAGSYTVTVSAAGYNSKISTAVTVTGAPLPVTFSNVSANGSETQTTTTLTLTFSQAITGLAATDITLSGVSGITKGTLGGSGPVYTLPVSGFTAGGTLSVAVAKSGHTISGSPKTVGIYYYTPMSSNAGIVINLEEAKEWGMIEQSVEVYVDVNVVLTVTGTYTAYRWYLDGAPVGTSPTYTFNKPDGVYQLVVVVTNSNGESRSGRCRITTVIR